MERRGTEVPAHGAEESVGASGGHPLPNVPEALRKASDHALDATRDALNTEMGWVARAEALQAALRVRVDLTPGPLLRGARGSGGGGKGKVAAR